MLFNFRFFSFAELISVIVPAKAYRPTSWFDLTDGWYWIEAGETHLFRYSQATYQRMKDRQPRVTNNRYVDYSVDVFLADIVEHLPAQLEPLPTPLVKRLALFGNWQCWLKTWNEWTNARDDQREEILVEEESSAAVSWWYERMLSTGYLTEAPNIWFWRDGTSMHISWDNRDCLRDGLPVWEAQMGQIQLPVADFLAAVGAFHQEFVSAMDKRIIEATQYRQDHWYVQDLPLLQQIQHQKAGRLEDALRESAQRVPTNWERVLASLALVEKDPLFLPIYQKILSAEMGEITTHGKE